MLLVLNVDFAGGENPIWFDTIEVFKNNGTTNELVNGDFETGDTSGYTGAFAPPSVGQPSGTVPQDGSFAMKLNGGGNFSAEQTFPITEGDQVSLSGYLLSENALLAGSFGLYKIAFRDANGTDLAPGSVTAGQASDPEFPGIDSLPFVDENSATNTWIFAEAAGTAPAGAVEVVFLGLNVDFGGGNGGVNPIWIDDVSASVPSAEVLLGDINLDGTVDFLDITPFIAVLSSGVLQCEADCNGGWNGFLLGYFTVHRNRKWWLMPLL